MARVFVTSDSFFLLLLTVLGVASLHLLHLGLDLEIAGSLDAADGLAAALLLLGGCAIHCLVCWGVELVLGEFLWSKERGVSTSQQQGSDEEWHDEQEGVWTCNKGCEKGSG